MSGHLKTARLGGFSHLWRDGRAGLRRTTGNRVRFYRLQGFESLSLRQTKGFPGFPRKPFCCTMTVSTTIRRRNRNNQTKTDVATSDLQAIPMPSSTSSDPCRCLENALIKPYMQGKCTSSSFSPVPIETCDNSPSYRFGYPCCSNGVDGIPNNGYPSNQSL